jgi:hypothetical protein
MSVKTPGHPRRAATSIAVSAMVALLLSCASEVAPSPDDVAEARGRAGTLIQEGYTLKQSGANSGALARFEQACAVLQRALGNDSAEVASCLDDQASVHVRIGAYDRASQLYYQALRIAGRSEAVDPLLLNGIRYRIALLGRLEKLGVRCAEPSEIPVDADLPYFPEIVEMQRSLGGLNPDIASCADGAPRPVTVKVTITGDGKPVMAETRGSEEGTSVGKCLEHRLMQAVPRATLPRFGACFRAFTYPFSVGDLPRRTELEQ